MLLNHSFYVPNLELERFTRNSPFLNLFFSLYPPLHTGQFLVFLKVVCKDVGGQSLTPPKSCCSPAPACPHCVCIGAGMEPASGTPGSPLHLHLQRHTASPSQSPSAPPRCGSVSSLAPPPSALGTSLKTPPHPVYSLIISPITFAVPEILQDQGK